MPRYRKPSGWGYIYVIKSSDGLYKVGLSVDPYRRHRELQKDHRPHKLWLLRVIETDNMLWTERQLHSLLHRKHIHGEWFALDQDDFGLIDMVEQSINAYLDELR